MTTNLNYPVYPKLNIYQDEGSLIKDIHQLRQYGHQARKQAVDKAMHIEKTEHELSIREIEVLILITKGLINKEIADKLHISLTTVISHRKNITEKLGIKSVSGLTVYAVMNGYIEADRILKSSFIRIAHISGLPLLCSRNHSPSWIIQSGMYKFSAW